MANLKSAWTPLKFKIFRAFWIASLVSNIGSWMQDLAQGWTMTSLTQSPFTVSLLQTANSLSFFLLALPAGIIADHLDRRKVLIFTQAWMLLASGTLAVLTFLHITTVHSLIACAFALGVGSALNAPAWHSVVSELVPRHTLTLAVTLNGMSYNLARTIGPALAGILVAWLGPGPVFAINSLSFLAVIFFLLNWQRDAQVQNTKKIHFVKSFKEAFHALSQSRGYLNVLTRSFIFCFFGGAFWGLLPLIARVSAGLGSYGYGLLLASFGTGAILSAIALPYLRERLSNENLVSFACFVAGCCMIILSIHPPRVFYFLTTAVLGGAWITSFTTLNSVTQLSVKENLRARALSFYLFIFQAGFAAGSAFWGRTALHTSIAWVLGLSGIGLIVSILARVRFKLPEIDLSLT